MHTGQGLAWIETDYLFTTRHGTPVEPRNLQPHPRLQLWTTTGLRRIRLHDLRYSCVNLLQMGGIASDASFDEISERILPATSSIRIDHGLG
jgi:hypothetical protein